MTASKKQVTVFYTEITQKKYTKGQKKIKISKIRKKPKCVKKASGVYIELYFYTSKECKD